MGSLFAALGLVFIAELGDKTQLVALGFGARRRLAPVLAGIALAYAACNLLSVVVGGLLGAALPTRAIGIAGGVLFLGFALLVLHRPESQSRDPAVCDLDHPGHVAAHPHGVAVLWSTPANAALPVAVPLVRTCSWHRLDQYLFEKLG